MPHCWALTAPSSAGHIFFNTGNNGRCAQEGPESRALDIVRIVPKWNPREGDVVKVIGTVVKLGNYGAVSDYLRARRNSATEFTILLAQSPEEEFYRISPATGGTYVVHRDQMRLVRRGT